MTWGDAWAIFVPLVIAGFTLIERKTVQNNIKGDTLSEKTRKWLRTDTPGGGWSFIGLALIALGGWVWFVLLHIHPNLGVVQL